MSSLNMLGFLAGACTTAAFVPQVWQVWRTRSARDLSLGMYLVLVLGVMLWLVYGLLCNDMPLVIANIITLILAGSVLVMKVYFERKR
ncbi:MAG: SemiSWEET transporter [Iodobacter sp.]